MPQDPVPYRKISNIKIMEEHIGVYYQTVEKAIKNLGVDPVKTRKKEGHWLLVRNNNPVWLYLTYQPASKGYYFQVAAPIVDMPNENRGVFCEQLLSLNSELIDAAFIEKKGSVYISTMREVKGLSVREAFFMIARVGKYSNYYINYKEKGLLNWPFA